MQAPTKVTKHLMKFPHSKIIQTFPVEYADKEVLVKTLTQSE